MTEDQRFQKGMLPLKLQGDLQGFEAEYLHQVMELDMSDEQQARGLINAIWVRLNEEWQRGNNENQKDSD